MNRSMKIILLVAGGVIMIGLIAYFIIVPVFTANAPAPAANANKNVGVIAPAANANSQPPVNSPVPPPAEVAPAAKQAAAARSIALSFAARLGTYTNQNDLANLNDLQNISTAPVWKYINGDYRNSVLKTLPVGGSYYAMTSTVVNAALVPVSDAEMSAKVQLQRSETGSVVKVSYATLDLILKKVNDNWLVARLDW